MSKIFELIAKDDEEEGCPPLKFDGMKLPFAIFLRKFKDSMEHQGFHEVLRGDAEDVPIRPVAVINRLAGIDVFNPPQPGDGAIADAYVKKKKIWDDKCQRVLGAFKRCLSKEVQDDIREVGTNMNVATRENILALIEATRMEHGSYKDGQAQLNYDQMRTIPTFKDVASTKAGLKRMSELIEEREGWNNAPELWTDSQKKQFLLNKMKDWPAIDFIHSTCDNDPLITYAQCKLHLTRKIKKIQDVDLVTSRLSRELATKASPLYSHLAHEMNQDKDMIYYADSSNSSMLHQLHSNTVSQVQPLATRDSGVRKRLICYNCGQFDHFANKCLAPFCSRCWNDGLEHNHPVQQCPVVRLRNSTRAPVQQSFLQPQLQQSTRVAQKRSIQQLAPLPIGPLLKQPSREPGAILQPRSMSIQPRMSGYPPRGTGLSQPSSVVVPQLQRRYVGNVIDIMAEVEHYGEDPNDPVVLQALMGAIQTQLSYSNPETPVDIPEDVDWDPNQS